MVKNIIVPVCPMMCQTTKEIVPPAGTVCFSEITDFTNAKTLFLLFHETEQFTFPSTGTLACGVARQRVDTTNVWFHVTGYPERGEVL